MADVHKVGLTFGALFGGVHILWVLLVALDWAQPLVDFLSWAHMVVPVATVGVFDLSAAATLVVVASLVGYAAGCVGASAWNRFHR